jgi:uncharacterized membrane protein YkvA (DUF1232 family)
MNTPSWWPRWQAAPRRLKQELQALAIAYGDPRTPWTAKVVTVVVLAYALSPLDLIPDPIPILGYLDDLVLLPMGIWLALRLIPPAVMAAARLTAQRTPAQMNRLGWIGAGLIALLWLAVAWWLWKWLAAWVR